MSPITEEDNGTWMCKVYGADETGTVEGFAEIEVVVAVPPQTVNLRYVAQTPGGAMRPEICHKIKNIHTNRFLNSHHRINGEQVNSDKIETNLDAEGSGMVEIDCVAAEARPQPEFKWFIGTDEIKVCMAEIWFKTAPNIKSQHITEQVSF